MKLHVIDNRDELLALIEYLGDKEFVAYDCETTGLTKEAKIIGYSVCAEEDIAYYVICYKWNVEAQKLESTGLEVDTLMLINSLVGKQLIAHNSVFDCWMAENNFKIKLMPSIHTDTMILAHLLNENRRVGLKDLAASMFGDDSIQEMVEMRKSISDNGGSLTKFNYELYKGDAHLIGKYGAKDALLTYKLFLALVPDLYDQGLDKFFYEEESMPLLRGPTYELNTTGLVVNRDELTKLKKTLESECLEAKDFIHNEIALHVKEKYPGTNKRNHFNIESNQQLAWLLFSKLEFEFGTLTKEGKTVCKALGLRIPYSYKDKKNFMFMCESSKGNIYQPEGTVNGKKVRSKKIKDPWCYIAADKKTLTDLSDKRKWIHRLLEYKRKMKILTTYVVGIEERVQYGIISPQFLQHGTTSGRYSSRNPNFQNLPRDDKRVKAVITARPGKVFVGADYSQLEPRVFAYFSKDRRLLASFAGTDDFYSVIGQEVYGKYDCTPQKDGSPDAFGVKYKKLRDLSKVIALASTYGATANRLAGVTGKSIQDTQTDIDNYFEAFPGVAEMMLESHKMAKENGQVTNLFGRPRRMPEAKKFAKIYGDTSHADLPYEARNVLNLAVNHRIQSTGASIVNRAAIRFHENLQKAGIDAKLSVQVHDSLVAECNEDDAELVALLLQDAMERTIELEGIKLEAIPKIGKNLSEV